MNDLTQAAEGGAIGALAGLKAGLQNVQSTLRVSGGDPFLRMMKDGAWVYGAEDTEVEEGSLWAINPISLRHGYVSWTDHDDPKKKNEIVGEVMVPMTAPLPAGSDLKETGWKWSQQLELMVACVSGEDEGTQVLYKSTSHGGKKAINELVTAIMKQLDKDPGKPVPVVELMSEKYKHQKWGPTANPVLKIAKWVALDATDTEDATEQPAKAARRAPAAVAAAEPEAEGYRDEPEAAEASPVSRRRRRA
jgi:hypothetical protein